MSDNYDSPDEEIIEEEEILVGKWDCDNCDTLGNDGDSYDCKGCGAPRSEDVQFYLGESPRVVKDQAGIDAANAGLDWYCTYCDSGNSNTGSHCDNCGAKKGSARHHKIKITIKDDEEKPKRRAPAPRRRVEKPPFPKALIVAALVAIPSLLLCFSGLFLSSSHEKQSVQSEARSVTVADRTVSEYPATLVEHVWARKIEIEESHWEDESSWSLPSRGEFQVTAKKEEFHHNLRVLDRYETETYKEAYKVKVGERRVQTGWKKVQDGTRRAKVGTRKVAAGTRKVIKGYKKVRSGTKRVQTGYRKVKVGREKVVTGRKRVITRYRTETKTVNLGNGRFKRKTKRIPVYGYKNVYGYRDKYRQEPVYESRPAYRKEPVYGQETIYKDEDVYGDVPKYKKVAVYGMEDILETRYRDKTRQVPIYKKVPVNQTKYYYRIKRWRLGRVAELEESNLKPRWPATNLEKNERLGRKRERYSLHFNIRAEGKTIDHWIPIESQEDWAAYSKSQSYRALRPNYSSSFVIRRR